MDLNKHLTNGFPNFSLLSRGLASHNLELITPFSLLSRTKPLYANDLILTGNDVSHINKVKRFLFSTFHMKYLDYLRNFLGIEVD